MIRRKRHQEDPELSKLRQSQQQLELRQKECAEIPRRLALELRERECTMPPLPDIADREKRRAHEEMVSRNQAKNILRDQNNSLLLLFMLISATVALVWWGLTLMQG
jgi:hypothetical protein